MSDPAPIDRRSDPVLLFSVGQRLAAIALREVAEVMRPLPVEALPGVPTFVRGTCVVRGVPTPVIDLRQLLSEDCRSAAGHLLAVRADGERRVAVLVDRVLGVHTLPQSATEPLAPLLRDAATDFVEALARLDDRVLTVLRTARLVPPAVWDRIAEGGA